MARKSIFSRRSRGKSSSTAMRSAIGAVGLIVCISLFYYMFVVFVPRGHIGVLIKRTGEDVSNNDEIAPTSDHKGVQKEFLTEGYTFLIPYFYDWEIVPHVEIPNGKLGVLVSLTGENLPYGEYLAKVKPDSKNITDGVTTKGIVPNVLREGRYPINPYMFNVELHDPVVIPAGFKGVVTNLAGTVPEDPNQLLVDDGFRGVQKEVLDAQTKYINPYEQRIDLVDCRSQRFNLSTNKDMGFPTKDGFWVSLDGVIEFAVKPEMAAQVYVTYNDDSNGNKIDEEIVRKVIMPIARSFCRVEGSKSTGRDFISGDTRSEFESRFQQAMRENCEPLGIEIIQALIQEIYPPQLIADPIRKRELSKQDEANFQRQTVVQKEEQKLAIEEEMKKQKPALVQAEQEVVKVTTQALREQEVAVTEAKAKLEVAKFKLQAAKDEAAAILARGKAEADVIEFKNEAEAAGWARSVEAFGKDGNEFARYVLYQKMSSAYRRIMANTADSPIMEIFKTFNESSPTSVTTPDVRKANDSKPKKTDTSLTQESTAQP